MRDRERAIFPREESRPVVAARDGQNAPHQPQDGVRLRVNFDAVAAPHFDPGKDHGGAHHERAEDFQARAIRLIVHEDAHGLRSFRRRRGLRAEPELVEAPVHPVVAGRMREVFAVVGLGVVNGGREHHQEAWASFRRAHFSSSTMQ